MICQHKSWKKIDALHSECIGCKVWKGVREDSHHYDREYYHAEAFGLFRDLIPLRTTVYAGYQYAHWGPLGIKFNFTNCPRTLEIGAGAGLLSYSLFLDGCDSVAVDSSDWAAKWMVEAYGQHERFKSIWGNFETMDRSQLGLFDFIFANHVWEHLEDPMEVTEWCAAHLEVGGKLFLIVPDKERELAMHHTHNWAYCDHSLRQWFAEVGLKKVDCQAFKGGEADSEGGYLRIVGYRR
jgi:2-polyprenyl-3-methyl-5-hydroxy-6-metoxy-1,4-benzoquinol methylase